MARPTLYTHPKFRRLCYELRMPEPHVLGHLEYLWRVAYESGQATMGDAVDVELAAMWAGEPGAFAAALVNVRLFDEIEPNVLAIHDLEHHEPEYVKARRRMERHRRERKTHPNATVTQPLRNGYPPPAPAPAPAPAPISHEGVGTAPPAAAPRAPRKPGFTPPGLDEVRAEVSRRSLAVDPEAFLAHYQANGWVQGRGKPIRDWCACLTTWAKNEGKFGKFGGNGNGGKPKFNPAPFGPPASAEDRHRQILEDAMQRHPEAYK